MPTPSPRRFAVVLTGALALALGGAAAPARAATTVDLGTAGAFAVLAGSGITNTGVTTIDGDIGTSPSPAETGTAPCPSAADCIVLTGTNHAADATALQAKQDLTTAYDAAAGQPADAALAADLGGLTFTAGVYNASSSLGLTGEVTLDGQNVAGAVFIFQIGSSLVTAAGSLITLVNGADACNVFFQVGSAATLGTGSTFRGTIMAHDNISLGDAVTVEGRLLGGEQASGTGAVTLIHDTITVPSCGTGGSTGGTSTGTSSTGGSTGTSSTGGSTGTSSTGGSTGTTGTTTGSTGTSGTSSTGGSSTGSAGTTGASGSSGTSGGSSSGSTGATAGGETSGTATGGSAGSADASTGSTVSGDASAGTPTATALPFSGSYTTTLTVSGLLLLLLGASALVGGRAPLVGAHVRPPDRRLLSLPRASFRDRR